VSRSNSTKTTAAPNHVRQKVQSVSSHKLGTTYRVEENIKKKKYMHLWSSIPITDLENHFEHLEKPKGLITA
jgi:hypothetical protein